MNDSWSSVSSNPLFAFDASALYGIANEQILVASSLGHFLAEMHSSSDLQSLAQRTARLQNMDTRIISMSNKDAHPTLFAPDMPLQHI